jgi:hypothetical protein
MVFTLQLFFLLCLGRVPPRSEREELVITLSDYFVKTLGGHNRRAYIFNTCELMTLVNLFVQAFIHFHSQTTSFNKKSVFYPLFLAHLFFGIMKP